MNGKHVDKRRTCLGCDGPVSRNVRTGYCAQPGCLEISLRVRNMTMINLDHKCEGCGNPLHRFAKTSYCVGNPECRSKNRKARAILRSGLPAQPENTSKCTNCGGSVSNHNKTGICRANKECATLNRRANDLLGINKRRERLASKPKPKTKEPYKDKSILDEDGVTDQLAIDMAVSGVRKVNLTESERLIALGIMVNMADINVADIIRRLSLSPKRLNSMLTQIGWEIILDPISPGGAHRRLVARIDRPKDKLLDKACDMPLPDLSNPTIGSLPVKPRNAGKDQR